MDVQRCGGSLVPGLRKEDAHVAVTDEALVIEGERKQEHKEVTRDTIAGNAATDASAARSPCLKEPRWKAELEDGLLKVSIPLNEVSRRIRQIPVTG